METVGIMMMTEKLLPFFAKIGFPFVLVLTLMAVTIYPAASNASPGISGMDQVQASPTSGRAPFLDCFETNTANPGNLNGQNGWNASPNYTAQVQTNIVWEGQQAVLYDSATVTSEVRRLFNTTPSHVVWVDFHAIARGAKIPPEPTGQLAAFLIDAEGRLIVQDGKRPKREQWVTLTNQYSRAKSDTWVRFTVKMDFDNQRWLICLNGNKVAENLGFGKSSSDFREFVAKGRFGGLDQVCVSTNTPPGMLSDEDSNQTCNNAPESHNSALVPKI
jgi:hypothetical protein